MSSPTGRLKPTDPPFAFTPINYGYDYSALMREVDFSEVETRVLAQMIDKRRRNMAGSIYEAFYGAQPTTNLVADTTALTWDMMQEIIDDMIDRELQQKVREVETLERAGIRVMINPYVPEGQIVATLPSSYQKALEAVMEKFKAQQAAS